MSDSKSYTTEYCFRGRPIRPLFSREVITKATELLLTCREGILPEHWDADRAHLCFTPNAQVWLRNKYGHCLVLKDGILRMKLACYQCGSYGYEKEFHWDADTFGLCEKCAKKKRQG